MIRRCTATVRVGQYQVLPEPDEAGDDVVGYAYRDVPVYAVAPSSSEEPNDRNRSSVVTAWDIYAPVGTRIGPHDVVQVPGVKGNLQVIGEPALWEASPYGVRMGNAGVVVKVGKTDG